MDTSLMARFYGSRCIALKRRLQVGLTNTADATNQFIADGTRNCVSQQRNCGSHIHI